MKYFAYGSNMSASRLKKRVLNELGAIRLRGMTYASIKSARMTALENVMCTLLIEAQIL